MADPDQDDYHPENEAEDEQDNLPGIGRYFQRDTSGIQSAALEVFTIGRRPALRIENS